MTEEAVTAHSLTPVLRALRSCLHLMVAALLALAAVRAVADRTPDAPAVLAAAAALCALYVTGPRLPRLRTSTGAAALWLAALGLVWLVLLALTPDGVWVAFPLFFVQLHLLPRRWALPAVAATTLAAIAGFGWHTHTLSVGTVLGPALGAAVAVAVVLGYEALYRESEQRRRLIEELTATRGELADAEHAAGVLAERERLAREIHDTLAQGLSSIQLLLRAAERALPERPGSALGHVRQARTAAVDNLAEARRFVRALSPPDLEAGSLPAALERVCATTARASGLAVHCQVSGAPTALPTPYEAALLRIAQSALANTVRHAAAGRVELTLSYMDTEVALDIVDDGTGFVPAEVPAPGSAAVPGTGFGLAAMRARARALQGTLVVESAPGEGTAVAVTLPCPAPAPGAAPEAAS
ncbi:sensor histidine kinase [Streptomyces platensis]|uniref:Oxygen sensor histidine kinase NreB n=1 Tax=Streptomyces platensis TaxID=58346 RepID=A0AAE6TSK6_STRPT|nr:sensor histidine kinase [Streptomyces platensis]OSY40039.1 Sensor histidine kinase LiaS [Streptomyces platensis]QEV55263.1 sensor histidine kinase [Streptomyces platensis]